MRSRLPLIVAAAGLVCAALAAWLFPRAFPIVALRQQLTRETALQRADSFFRAHDMAPASARTAVRFERNDSLRTFVELAGGGGDSLNALVRGRDVAPFTWSVRAFVPGDVREARVDFAPDGRILGFERKLAEADVRPTLSADSARRIAERVLATWVDPRPGSWRPAGASFETKKTSNRVDHTFTWERADRRVAGAPVRIEAVVAGDTPSRIRPYVEVPQSFMRRYGEMRSWNELLSVLASLGILAIALAGMAALARFARAGAVRWKEALLVGGAIGLLTVAAALNELPGSWFYYDTATSPATFRIELLLMAVLFGVATVLMTGFTLAAAEAATRAAFPRHLDWWKLWRYRGTREVASATGAGYAVAAVAFAYVALFYLVTRTLFGWWVPSELLDDPNLVASPMPWLSGLALSLNAAVWEEALFRALPLSLLSLWVGSRPRRGWWMAAGVVVTALVFGFAHANYESWPPYSRGVEIFLDACFWAVLFLRFGLLVTVVAHFVYNAVLFGIFAAQGSAPEYRVTAAIILAALLAPAAIVLWKRVRAGRFAHAPDDARFGAWTPAHEPEPEPEAGIRATTTLTPRARRLAIAAAVAAAALAVGRPRVAPRGPEFTATRAAAVAVADSTLRARGADPAAWKRLTLVGTDTLSGWPRFLRQHEAQGEAHRLAGTYAIPTWWIVRYVRTGGAAAERIEEWRVRVRPDGRLLDVRHLIPDSLPRDTADSTALRRIARLALAREGVDTLPLRETDVTETPRPFRRDVTVRYTDTAHSLPAGAAARAWVTIAGNEPLVARRGIELPETFERAERQRTSARMAVFGVLMLVLLALVVTGALVIRRRRPIVVDDGHLSRGQTTIALVALALLMVLSSLNTLPSQLYGYDPAQPWSTHLGMTALGYVTSIVFVLLVYGLWLALHALRRRVGIPMAGDPAAARDIVAAGVGMAGAAYLTSGALALASERAVPPIPSTPLDLLVPPLAGVFDVPLNAIITCAVIGIPLLVAAGISARPVLRAVAGAALAAVVAGAAWAMQSISGDVTPLGAGLALAGGALVVVAILRWGAHAAWSWIVAALAFQIFAALRDAAHGPVWQVRVAAVLTAAVAAALIAALARRPRLLADEPGSAPAPASQPSPAEVTA